MGGGRVCVSKGKALDRGPSGGGYGPQRIYEIGRGVPTPYVEEK